jgi:putative hydrolase of the HAD superfamily
MKIDAVAFDIDGTLYPSWQMYCLSIPLFLGNLRFFRAFNRVRKELRKSPPSGDLHQAQCRLLSPLLGITDKAACDLIKKVAYTEWNRCFSRIRPFAGTADTIRKLRMIHLKTAVLSDFPLADRLERLGLDNLWDVEMSSEDTQYLKPSPKPFLMMAEKLGVSPDRILYVGNNYEYDAVGAAAVGMQTALIGSGLNKKRKVDIVFATYKELWDKIIGLYSTGGV